MLLYIILISLTTCHARGAEASDSEIRIVGGSDVMEGEIPYQVSLRYMGRHFCGGSIIYPDWVLTAAHCVETLEASQFSVVVGTNTISEGGSKYDVNSIFINKNYNSRYIQNDIALIKTKTSIKYQEPNIQNITLATKETPAGTKCLVSGWGLLARRGSQPNNLQKVELNVTSLESCQESYNGFSYDYVTSSNICAYKAIGKGTCQGDSGGPLVCDNELVGLVSFSSPCAVGRPSVLTKVYAFRKWIEDTINAN